MISISLNLPFIYKNSEKATNIKEKILSKKSKCPLNTTFQSPTTELWNKFNDNP
jgi:hypothetical protein